ncbi:MAG: hypothetical protein AB1742_07440 [bacterium]
MEADRLDALKLAYPFHKNEVSQRRAMEYVTGLIALGFFGLLTAAVLARRGGGLDLAFAEKILVTIGLFILADTIAYFSVKNYRRHSEIQRVIADMDAALGFFETGTYLPDRTLYPPAWRKSGAERTLGYVTRVAIIGIAALIPVIVIWIS